MTTFSRFKGIAAVWVRKAFKRLRVEAAGEWGAAPSSPGPSTQRTESRLEAIQAMEEFVKKDASQLREDQCPQRVTA